MAHVLICDDEKDIVAALRIYLEAEGYTTCVAYNGYEALEALARERVQLALLDVMMPGMDGIVTLAELRKSYNLPVILLTAKGEDTDKVLGLNMGADDYITKPFNPVELLARVRSQLRRYTELGGQSDTEADGCLRVGGLVLNDRLKVVTVDGEPAGLTPTEYEILKLCMQHPDEVLSPRDIYRQVWQEEPMGAEGLVAVHIRHLREKIEINPADPRYIKVVWGRGYVLRRGDEA